MTAPAEDHEAAIDHDQQPTEVSHPAIRGGGRGGTPRLSELGPYRIEDTLGWGGMGIVYAAVDTRSGDRVALKLLRFSDPEGVSLRRFQQEAEATRRLHHPGIVGLREISRAGAYDYFTMDLVEGRDFGTWLRDERPRLDTVVGVLAKVARAVDHAHRRQLLHRDLKPANIIIDRDGEPYVTDFGLARAIGAESSLTATDQAVGTPQYMSPEQARGRHQDCGPSSDVFAIGVMLYEALCGRQPFTGETVLDVMQQVVNQDPPLPRQVAPGAPPALERIVLQCLEKDPRHRYQSAEALADDLERYLFGQTVLARRYSTWTRALRWTRVRWKVLAGTIVSLAAVALAMWSLRQVEASDPGRWVEAWSWDCAAVGTEAAGVTLVTVRDAETPPEPWPAGERGVRPQRAIWCWLDEVAVAGDVRVELDVTTGDHLDGIEVALSSQREGFESWNHVPRGYSCQWAGYLGSLCFISRNERPHVASFAYGAASTLAHDADYTLAFSRRGEHLELRVDGRRVLDADYPLPMVGEDLDRIGFRFYAREIELRAVRVYRLAGAAEADPLALPDAALQLGRFDQAIDGYVATADAYGGELAARAIGRAYLAALQLDAVDTEARERLRGRLFDRHPDSAAALTALEVEAAAAWRLGQWSQAMDLADRCFARSRRTQVMYRILETGVHPTPPAAGRYLGLLGRTPDLRSIRLHKMALDDLSPLAGLELEWLDVDRNRISDLAPLRGMPLVWFTARENPIVDLGPLRGAPLRFVGLASTRIDDLEPLHGARLEMLDVSRTGVADLSPVAGPWLRELNVGSTPASGDLAQLEGVALNDLNVFEAAGPVDLSRLDLRRLHSFNARGSELRGVESLEAAPLRHLIAEEARFDGALRLAGRYHEIRLAVCDLASIDGLRPESVISLNLHGNRLSDLSHLADSRIEALRVGDNRIADLSPVAGVERYLEAQGNPLLAATVVDAVAEQLVLGDGHPSGDEPPPVGMADAELAQLIAAWAGSGRRPQLRRALAGLVAWRRGDHDELQALAQGKGDLPHLLLPLWCDRAAAAEVAAACGARLMTVAELEALGGDLAIPPGYWAWLADRHENGRPQIRGLFGEVRAIGSDDRCPLLLVWDPLE